MKLSKRRRIRSRASNRIKILLDLARKRRVLTGFLISESSSASVSMTSKSAIICAIERNRLEGQVLRDNLR
jgi:hypothetical protein